jgi:hypothetical protein
METEDLRRRYKSEEVHILFVGESPAAGGDFFYKPGSRLLRYTREAFEKALELDSLGSTQFLECFASLGCYLDDLCRDPVNRMEPSTRRRFREKGAESLASRMARAQPAVIIAVMMAIGNHVKHAARDAGLDDVPVYSLPFPSRGNQSRYVEQLTRILRTLKKTGVLPRVEESCGREKEPLAWEVST